MGGDHRGLGDFHNVPEALVADVADINAHAQTLGLPDVVHAQIRQTAAGDIGAGERIFFVPAQTGHPEADSPEVFQQFRIVVDAGSTFQSQNGRHFSGGPVFFNFLGRIDQRNQVLVRVDLPLDGGKLPFKQQHGRDFIDVLLRSRGKAGKALGIAAEGLGPLQVDMEIVFPQASCLVPVTAQQTVGTVAVKIKYREIH